MNRLCRGWLLVSCLLYTGCDNALKPVTDTTGGVKREYTPHPLEPGRFIGLYRDFHKNGKVKTEAEYDTDGKLLWSNHYDESGNLTGIGRQ